MNLSKLQLGAALAVAAAGVAALLWQNYVNGKLQAEVAFLPSLRAENARLRVETTRLAEAEAEAAGLRAEHAELVRLRAETAARRDAGAARPAPEVRSGPPLAAGLTPVESLGNAGRATPRAAFATQLWAARTGDVGAEAGAIMLTPAGRAKLEALMAKLPDAVRAEYEPPEKLMALVLAASPHPVGGMQVLGETPRGPDDLTLQTEWQYVDDTIVHHSNVEMHRAADGWQMVVPEILVDRAAAFLTRRTAAGQ